MSVVPSESLALAPKVCELRVSPEYDLGEEHPDQDEPSSWHSKVAPVVVEENVKLAEVSDVMLFGPAEIAVSGGVMMFHVWLAGLASTVASVSFALTLKVCELIVRPE